MGVEVFGDIDGLLNLQNEHVNFVFRQQVVQEQLHLGQVETFTRLAKLSEVTAV